MKYAALIMAILLTFSLAACTARNNTNDNGSNGNGANSGLDPDSAINGNNNNTTPGTNGSGSNGSNNGSNNGNSNGSNSSGNNSNSSGSNSENGSSGNNGSSGSSGSNGGSSSGNGSTPGSGSTGAAEKTFMYADKLYTVTDEEISQDKVGAELISISSVTDGEPGEEGSASGLDEGTRIFKLAQENEYKELAVEMNDKYYLAKSE